MPSARSILKSTSSEESTARLLGDGRSGFATQRSGTLAELTLPAPPKRFCSYRSPFTSEPSSHTHTPRAHTGQCNTHAHARTRTTASPARALSRARAVVVAGHTGLQQAHGLHRLGVGCARLLRSAPLSIQSDAPGRLRRPTHIHLHRDCAQCHCVHPDDRGRPVARAGDVPRSEARGIGRRPRRRRPVPLRGAESWRRRTQHSHLGPLSVFPTNADDTKTNGPGPALCDAPSHVRAHSRTPSCLLH